MRIDPVARVTLGLRSDVPLEIGEPVGNFRSARVSGDLPDFVELPGSELGTPG